MTKKIPIMRPTEAKALGTPIRDEPKKKSREPLGKVKEGGSKPILKTVTQVQRALLAKGLQVTLLQAAMLIGKNIDEAVEAAKTF